MDHHGLLAITRQVNNTFTSIHIKRHTSFPEWKWKATPVLFPESHCPFCQAVIRSPGVWFFRDQAGREKKYEKLIGAIFPGAAGEKVRLIQPSHPHDVCGGILCIGRNESGIALLSSTPNLNDSPMGRFNIPVWIKQYWNKHDCKSMRNYIDAGYTAGHISSRLEYFKRLDAI